jgi:L-fucose mutarotase
MLKGISPCLSPDFLKILAEMGHGDELVIGDGNFPAASVGKRCLRADGHSASDILDAVLALFPLDVYTDAPVTLMAAAPDEFEGNPPIWKDFEEIVARHQADVKFEKLGRFDFYARAEKAYATVATGETSLYACVIVKKGVL